VSFVTHSEDPRKRKRPEKKSDGKRSCAGSKREPEKKARKGHRREKLKVNWTEKNLGSNDNRET